MTPPQALVFVIRHHHIKYSEHTDKIVAHQYSLSFNLFVTGGAALVFFIGHAYATITLNTQAHYDKMVAHQYSLSFNLFVTGRKALVFIGYATTALSFIPR